MLFYVFFYEILRVFVYVYVYLKLILLFYVSITCIFSTFVIFSTFIFILNILQNFRLSLRSRFYFFNVFFLRFLFYVLFALKRGKRIKNVKCSQ